MEDHQPKTEGVLAVVACPMLEDELIHSLDTDPEEKDIVVIDTEPNASLRRKMDGCGLKYTVMDEWTFLNGGSLKDGRFRVVIRMNDLGLHAEPKDLMEFVQDELFMMQGRVDACALYYGMCGNYGWDITKWAEKELNYPVATFRDRDGRVCDDCVGVAVGGLKGYQRLIKEFTGVMLFTPAVATNWEDFLNASDMMKGVTGGSKESIKEILDMCGYTSVVQIDTGLEDRAEFDKATKEFADYMHFKILQASPDYIDTWPMDEIYRESKAMMHKSG